MTPFQSRQHKRRLVDEWPLEAAYRRMWDVVAAGLRAMDAELLAIRESEGRAMVGGTGGPRGDDDGGNGMRTETCSVCEGEGSIPAGGRGWRAHCRACGGSGVITIRTARQVVLDAEAARAERDRTLESVARIRAAAVARDVAELPADTAASLRAMRADYLSGAMWNDGEDR